MYRNDYGYCDGIDELMEMRYCPYYTPLFRCPLQYGYRQQQGPPTTAPPSFTPQLTQTQEATIKAVDPGAIKPCINTFSYIWLKNGQSFWAYIIYVGRTSVTGWKYQNRRWVYFGVDLKDIKSFTCY